MQLLRLRQIHNGVFIKVRPMFCSSSVSSFSQQQAGICHAICPTHIRCGAHLACCLQINKATVNMLKRVEPYVAWGYPNLKTVKELIYKRGYGKVSRRPCQLAMGSVSNSESCWARSCWAPQRHSGLVVHSRCQWQEVLMAVRPLCHQFVGSVTNLGRLGVGQLRSPRHLGPSAPLLCLPSRLWSCIGICTTAVQLLPACLLACKLLHRSHAQEGVPTVSGVMLEAGHLSQSAWLPPVGQQEQDPSHRQLHH